MFDMNNNTVSYTQWLKPDDGYELAFGVCCTYSLDLEAVTGTMLALGLNSELGDQSAVTESSLLMGIQKEAEKVAIFCSDCAIKSANKRFDKLVGVLDNSIFEVAPQSGGIFHPKVWFLQYDPIEGSGYSQSYVRLLILTRNLTFDQSLDYGIFLESNVLVDSNGNTNQENKPLVDMLYYLKRYMNKDTTNGAKKAEKFNNLVAAFENAEKFYLGIGDEDEYVFKKVDFIPIGISQEKESESLAPLFSKKKDWIFCVSPFLSPNIVEKLTNHIQEFSLEEDRSTLITRKESLTSDIANHFEYCYRVKDDFKQNQEEDNDTDNTSSSQNLPVRDIHAKMYFVKSGEDAWFYTGSANATHNAFNKNVEFLVHCNS